MVFYTDAIKFDSGNNWRRSSILESVNDLTLQLINLPGGMALRGSPVEDLYASGVLVSPWRLPPGLINENFDK